MTSENVDGRPVPYRAEMFPLNQGWATTYLFSVKSEQDPTGEDYMAGWASVHADARAETVDITVGGEDLLLSPIEARNLATALMLAADHAEHYAATVLAVLSNEQRQVSHDMHGQPLEAHRAVHEWFRRANHRVLKRGSRAER